MRFFFVIFALVICTKAVEATPYHKSKLIKKMRVNDETAPSTGESPPSGTASVVRHLSKAKPKPASVSNTFHPVTLDKTTELDDQHSAPQATGKLARNLRDRVKESDSSRSGSPSGASSEEYLTDTDLSLSGSSKKESGGMAAKFRGRVLTDSPNTDISSILESMPSKLTKKQKQAFENIAEVVRKHPNSKQITSAYNTLKTDDMSPESHLKLIKTLVDTNIKTYPSLIALHTELSQGLGGDSSATMLNVISRGFSEDPNFDAVAFKDTYPKLVVDGMRPLSRVAIAAQLINTKIENYPSIVATYKKFTDRALLHKSSRSMLVEALASVNVKHHDDFYNAYASIVSKKMTQEQRAEIFINLAENVQGDLYQKLNNIYNEMLYKGATAEARYAMFEGLLILNPNVIAWEYFRDNLGTDLDAAGILDVAKRLKVVMTKKPPLAKKNEQ